MRQLLCKVTPITGLALLISILPAAVAGQARSVVSNQLAISQTEAALNLEFSGGGTLEIALRNGVVMIDGEERGSFELGDALDTAWRNLLAEIVSLSDGPLGEALRGWEAPPSLADGALDLAQLLDRTLEDALLSDDVAASAVPESASAIDGTVPDLGQGLAELENLSTRIRLELLEELQGELRIELRDELRLEFENAGDRSIFLRAADAVGRGVLGVGGDLITFVFLSVLALGAVSFAKDNLEVVADTAQRDPMRAGIVGLAGAFLVVPAWLLGTVALAVSVVGIIALPFWALLFPVVVALGAGLGYLAVARNVGEWVASKNIRRLEWLRPTNTLYAVTAGIGTLLVLPVSASVLEIVPVLGFIRGLVATLGTLVIVATLLVGFGAVLLTRGGRDAGVYASDDPFVGETWQDKRTSEDVLDAEEFPDESAATGTEKGEQGDD